MFFRLFLKTRAIPFVLLSLILALGGCSEFLNGKKKNPETIELSDERFACLQELPESLKRFSVGEAEADEIQNSVTCMQSALSYFQRKTKGSLSEAYTVEDMRRFFGKYFLKKNNVTPQFAAELMKVKKALLGGSAQAISKQEIRDLVSLLEILKEEAIELAPHVRMLLSQDAQEKPTFREVATATEQLRESLQRILKETQVSKSDYSFADAKKVLAGFAEFVKGPEPFAPYERYSDWLPLVESVKNVLMGKKSHFRSLSDWSAALDNLIDLYELVLKYHYAIQDFSASNKTEMQQLSQFIDQSLSLLENSHQMKAFERIPFSDIDALLEQILPLTSWGLRVDSVKEAYQVLVLKALEPTRRGDARGLNALTRSHLTVLRREFNIWRQAQAFIDQLPPLGSKTRLSQSLLLNLYSQFDTTHSLGFETSGLEQRALQQAWADFGYLLETPRAMNFTEEGRVLISYQPEWHSFSWKSLSRFNLMSTLARFMMLGYGTHSAGELAQARLSEKSLTNWYEDFNGIGRDLKAFDPRSVNVGQRSFLEASFFTSSGNGDDSLDFRETFEFVSLLVSAGMGSSNAIQAALLPCAVGPEDVFGFKMFDQGCFQENLRQNFAKYFANLPGMATYVKNMKGQEWNEFFHVWLSASRVAEPTEGRVEVAELRTMVTLLHYVENMMTLYDRDHSGGLSVSEVHAAAPRFMSFLRAAAPAPFEFLITEGFTVLVFEGKIPGIWGISGFQFTKWFKDEAPRANLLRILHVLKDELNKAKK